jgi:hypothetical protein
MAPGSVEVVYFEGCPNHEATRELVRRVMAEEGVETELRLVEVASPEDAERINFLGSPTVRVNGRDIEPGADARRDYAFSCRVYRTESGLRGQPDERWLRAALRGDAYCGIFCVHA